MNFAASRLWQKIGRQLDRLAGFTAPAEPLGHVGGGDINQAMRMRHGHTEYFVKLNHPRYLPMFEAEADGLAEITRCGALRCPKAITSGLTADAAFLVLEYLQLDGQGSGAALGEGLARMHRASSQQHGWHRDNTIGSTPQSNVATTDWINFWRNQRLGFQLERAGQNGYKGDLQRCGLQLMETLPRFFENYDPVPSLLHGDLWGGNYGWLTTGEPVIFDPAVYFGDRETDLAMTELFGGFSNEFYAAYQADWPLDSGYAIRKHLYQLYHVLNHLNLFGTGYLARAENLTERLLAELS